MFGLVWTTLHGVRSEIHIVMLLVARLETNLVLPRSQTSLSLRKGWARKGGREGERMRDVWQILFSRWRNVQWRMITQFSKRSIDLFVLRIWRKSVFSSFSVPGGSCFPTIERATAYRIRHLAALSMPKNYRRNRLSSARTKKSCTAMMLAMYLLHTGGLLEYCRGKNQKAIYCNTGAMFDHVLKRR